MSSSELFDRARERRSRPKLSTLERDRARRFVAGRATDVDDARELLEMLGLVRPNTPENTVT